MDTLTSIHFYSNKTIFLRYAKAHPFLHSEHLLCRQARMNIFRYYCHFFELQFASDDLGSAQSPLFAMRFIVGEASVNTYEMIAFCIRHTNIWAYVHGTKTELNY